MNRDASCSNLFSRTKVTPPISSPYEVPRRSILQRVCESACAVVVVHAPAGFGKTTLMAQLRTEVQARGEASAWLALDEGDNDVSRFLAGFAAAIQGLRVPEPVAAKPPLHNSDVALWIMDRISAVAGPLTLFFDNLEALHNPIVVGLMARGFDAVPPHVRIVASARALPDIGLARLRAKGGLLEIEADSLRFSEKEAHDFLVRRRGMALTNDQVARLLARTEGWAAALWLASLALERCSNPAAFLADFSGSNAAIADYLAEDVLAALSQELREFVLRSSVLDELSPALCDAVCGVRNSLQMLQQLERLNLFIQPVDGQACVFRYHRLFRDFLRTQLERYHVTELPVLHRTACAAYLEAGRPIPAIQHALRAGAIDIALQLLEQHVDALLNQGRLRLIREWLSQLPEAELTRRPQLRLIYAWCLTFTRGPGEALRLVNRLDATTLPEDSAAYLLALRPMLLAMTDRIEEAHRLGLETLDCLPSKARFAHAMLCQALAQTSIILGRHGEARHFIEQARDAQREAANAFGIALAESASALLDLMGGRLKQASACMTAIANRPVHADFIGNAVAAVQLAEVLYESDQCEAAQRLLFVNVPLVQEVGLPDALITAHVIQSRIADAGGDYEHALDSLHELEISGYRLGLPRAVASAHLERSRLYLAHDDPAEALTELELAEKALNWGALRACWFVANDTLTPDIARMRWMIRTGDAESAVPLLRASLAAAEQNHRHRRALKLRILLAEAFHRSNERRLGLRTLARAQHLARQEGFVRSFLEEGPLVLAMLREIGARRNEEPSEAACADVPQRRSAGTPSDDPTVMLDDPLTHKELQVLTLLAQGCRNTVMAERLFVSESTVRTHLRNINLKLHAANRTEAVVIARRLGLIA
ncbi:MAG: LuxR C-terminal-related transcriptional regulator [Sinobacteraceae bacterium]|nr:LuxR C-terminal-related transcriptional regulator [Nevskiaceae bacterium]